MPLNRILAETAANRPAATAVPAGTFFFATDTKAVTSSDGTDWLPVSVPAGVPEAFTSRTLTDADNGKNLICAGTETATVDTGLPLGFGCSFKGVITFDGTATVTDVRTTGATNPWCELRNTGTDTYDCVGSAPTPPES